MKRLPLQINDPGHFCLKRAARAAIVMPGVFAFADQVIGDPDIPATWSHRGRPAAIHPKFCSNVHRSRIPA